MQPGDPVRETAAAARETRAALLACAIACAAIALSGVYPIDNSDSFGHLAQGRQIAALGHVPSHDAFSFWKPEPAHWRNYEWLSDVLGWLVYDAGGPNALIALKCAVLALGAGLIVALAWLVSGPRAAIACALLLIAAIPAARFRFTVRPHLVALPLSALYLIALAYLLRGFGRHRARADAPVIAALFVLHVLWVNLHGSHLLGIALTVVHLLLGFEVREARGKLAAVLGLQALASCISPYGPAIAIDALEHTFDPRYRELVIEWASWQPEYPLWLLAAPIAHTLLLAMLVRPLLRGGAIGRSLLATACVLALASFRSVRFVAEYLMLGAPVIAIGASHALSRLPWRGLRDAALLAGVGVALAALWGAPRLPPNAKIALGTSGNLLPFASGEWLARNARAPRVLAAVEDAWYLMFAAPQARFLVDGRIAFYGPEHVHRVRRSFADLAAFDRLLADFDVDTVVVRHTFEPQRLLRASLPARPDWALVSVEDRYAVFVRRDLQLRGGRDLRPISLQPGYELEWLVTADAQRERAILGELARLPEHDNRRGYAGWVRAVLALKPWLRAGGHDGLRVPESAAGFAALERAQRWLERASIGAKGVPIVHAYHGLVAATRCDFGTAERAFAQARWEGESRQTLLGVQEIAVRRGDHAAVRRFLQHAASLPDAAGDVWLAALRGSLRAPPRCP